MDPQPTTAMSPLARAIAGAAALALAMGVGRFAYTALLPSVQRGIGLDDAAAGAVASMNLVGYLAGVVWARGAVAGRRRTALLRVGLVASVLTTAAVAGSTGFAAWIALRFLSGVASGAVFVLVSTAVLEALPVGREHLAGVLYAGVGCGMALSGAVAAGTTDAAWPVPWLLLGAVSAGLAVPAWQVRPAVRTSAAKRTVGAGDHVSLGRLGAAYFLEGLGYIVSGTFAVAAVQRRPELAAWAPWVWVAAGLAAAPSAVVWSGVARRFGPRKALVAAFGAQAMGMSLPALSSSASAAMAGDESAGSDMPMACAPKAATSAFRGPNLRATPLHTTADGAAASPAATQTQGAQAASSGRRWTAATANVPLTMYPSPSRK